MNIVNGLTKAINWLIVDFNWSLLISILILILSYYRGRALRAKWRFKWRPYSTNPGPPSNNPIKKPKKFLERDDVAVRFIKTKDEVIDIKETWEAVRDDSDADIPLDDSYGIEPTKFCTSPDDANSVCVPPDDTHLFLIGLWYEGKVIFNPFVFWIHFWPPEQFRILRPEEDRDEIPRNDLGAFHCCDALLLNPTGPKPDYENLAYKPIVDKQMFQIRRGSVRIHLDLYTSGHHIFIPLWVHVREHDELKGLDDLDLHGRCSRPEHGIQVVVDPGNLPIRQEKWIKLEID